MKRRYREEPTATERSAANIEALKEGARRHAETEILKEDLRRRAVIEAPKGKASGSEADEPTDEQLWQSYVELQDGTAGRQRALQNARREEQEREEEWLGHYRTSGSPLNVDHEHLRPRLRGYGY